MPFPVDSSRLSFTLRFEPTPDYVWTPGNGGRGVRTDEVRTNADGAPVYSYACLVQGAGRDDLVRVKVPGQPPAGLLPGTAVTFSGLVVGEYNGRLWLRADSAAAVGHAAPFAAPDRVRK